jgi:hypothetical protein
MFRAAETILNLSLITLVLGASLFAKQPSEWYQDLSYKKNLPH